ncbi:unnamed protein product [Microthlaspi erraticum]|uniref:Uncharacterized protein n=1 Tax=Microthlaspi erraticum TaxID=1685480 RepID=A0A6D2IZI2_9BRAS|nr:unnamed protein product [Microthlaspi erraticum]
MIKRMLGGQTMELVLFHQGCDLRLDLKVVPWRLREADRVPVQEESIGRIKLFHDLVPQMLSELFSPLRHMLLSLSCTERVVIVWWRCGSSLFWLISTSSIRDMGIACLFLWGRRLLLATLCRGFSGLVFWSTLDHLGREEQGRTWCMDAAQPDTQRTKEEVILKPARPPTRPSRRVSQLDRPSFNSIELRSQQ